MTRVNYAVTQYNGTDLDIFKINLSVYGNLFL